MAPPSWNGSRHGTSEPLVVTTCSDIHGYGGRGSFIYNYNIIYIIYIFLDIFLNK